MMEAERHNALGKTGEETFFTQLALLAKSYLPEWKYNPGTGEAASALLWAGGELLLDSRVKAGQLFYKHELAFLNCLDPSAREAQPPCCRLAFRLDFGEASLKKGTRLYAPTGEGIAVFSLRNGLGLNGVRLMSLLLESPASQKAVRLCPPKEGQEPQVLFDFSGEGLHKNEVRFYHPDIFCGREESVLRLSILGNGQESLRKDLADSKKVSWVLEKEEESYPVPAPVIESEELCFRLPPGEMDCLCCRWGPESPTPVTSVTGVGLWTERYSASPQQVFVNGEPVEPACFLPFGRELSPYSECIFGADDILRQGGSQVTLRFSLSFRHMARELPKLEEPELRYVMKRPKTTPQLVRHQVCADEVRLDYYNGRAWVPVPGLRLSGLFSGEEGLKQLEFICPEDMSACLLFGEEKRWLRLRLVYAENSGWLPCVFHAPELRGLRLSCCYGKPQPPAWISRRGAAAEKRLLPSELREGASLFERLSGGPDVLYLGFDRRPPSPFRFYLQLSERRTACCTYSYSRGNGSFSPLEVQDRTDGLSHSGEISFSAPDDFAPAELYGERHWWLQIEDTHGHWKGKYGLPSLEGYSLCSVAADGMEGWEKQDIPAGTRFFFLEGGCAAEAWSLTAPYGGSTGETIEQTILRTEGELRRQSRAVTLFDLEQLLSAQVRDVARVYCRLDPENRMVTVAVLMRDFENRQDAFERRRPELERLVEDGSSLTGMGLRWQIRQPDPVWVRVTVWLRGRAESPMELEGEALAVLERFLHPVNGGFDGMGWPIGVLPLRDQVSACLRLSLPELTVEELILSRHCPETGMEEELESCRGNPFALTVSGPHAVHLRAGPPPEEPMEA